jgi:hypothetical protein
MDVLKQAFLIALWGVAASQTAAIPPALAQNATPSVAATVTARDRTALLAVMRMRSERDLGRPIVFVVKTMTVRGDVAFVATMPQRPSGQPIDIRQTPVGRRGVGDEWDGVHTEGLLFRRNGAWILEHYSVGSTDVWYDNPDLCPRYGSVLPAPICKR